jgi:hypothetical protein
VCVVRQVDSGIFSAVEEVEHLLQAPTLGAVVGGTEGVAVGVSESVVRGTTRQVDELEDLTLRPEPLKDVRVVGAGSTFRGHLDFFHGYIIPHLGPIASPKVDLFSILSSYAPRV